MHDALQTTHGGVELGAGLRLKDVCYADDVALLADDPSALSTMLQNVTAAARAIGLIISVPKSKIFSCCNPDPWSCAVNGEDLEVVDCFKYLGSTITPSGNIAKEITVRINAATTTFERLRKHLWNSSLISVRTKYRIYMAAVRPVLLYGAETWPTRAEDVRRLQVFENRKARQILGVSYRDMLTNKEVMKQLGIHEDVATTIQKARVKWLGHVLRMDDSRLPKQALSARPGTGWKRPRGGVFQTWRRLLADDMYIHRGFANPRKWKDEWMEHVRPMAADRKQWTALARDLIVH
jgi:hypothetical protein